MAEAAEDLVRLAAGEQTVWIDTTPFLSEVCSELKVGELVHGENFSLFEAMAALEIMDPKMDAGMATAGFRTVDEALDSGAAPINLHITEVLDVLDHLLACEATWHKGHSLAQTVFSCIYLLRLDRTLPNQILHAYCRIVRTTCNLVRTAVSLAHTHEEEDLFVVAFGLPLDEADTKGSAVLHLVEESVARQLRAATSTPSKSKEVEPLQSDPSLEEGFCQAVLSRLRFRKALYHTLVNMDKPHGRGLEMARKHIASALAELTAIRSSSLFLVNHHHEQSCSVDAGKGSTASGRHPKGFDESLNRWLLAPAPPRSIKLLTWSEALEYFERLLQDLDRVCSLPLNLSLEDLLQFVVDFQRFRPGLVARARLQLLLLQEEKLFGVEPLANAIRKSVLVAVPSSVQETNPDAGKFFQQAGRFVIHLFKVLCANPAWQRRKLGKSLPEWSNLLQEAENVFSNHEMQKWEEMAPVRWVATQICWIAGHFLTAGFDLELYSCNEYSMIYWYLDHILKLQGDILQEKPKSLGTPESTKKKGKSKKATLGKDARSGLLLQCYRDICNGLIMMLVALTKDHKLKSPEMNFNTEQERYIQRFELLFKVLIPPPMTYLDFKHATKFEAYPVESLYQMSYKHFMNAQKELQELGHSFAKLTVQSSLSHAQRRADIKQMEQVVVRNQIALQIAHQAGPGDSLRVSFEFSQHPFFAVAVVKKPQAIKPSVRQPLPSSLHEGLCVEEEIMNSSQDQ